MTPMCARLLGILDFNVTDYKHFDTWAGIDEIKNVQHALRDVDPCHLLS